MNPWFKKRDVLQEKYGNAEALQIARQLLHLEEQSEDAFLGAQAVLLLQGLL
jgi:hypothetical protein